jgi:glycosyltransferase involved in cell wall biosynthesis
MIRVALASHATLRASAGMRAYTAALRERVERVAPDVHLIDIGAPIALQPLALRLARAELTHIPYLDVAPLPPRPYVAMLHDCIQLRLPALYTGTVAAYWRFVAGPLYRNATRVLVSDARVAADGAELLGVRPERFRIVPLGYGDGIPDAQPWPAERPYAFYAGNHRAHKDLRTLYAAWASLPDDLVLDLVLTGPDEPSVRRRYVRTNGSIAFLGTIDEATLAQRYRGAAAYVQPSLIEGFGLPALEAAVAGTPVIATTTSIAQIVAPYAHTFAAGDVPALASLLAAAATGAASLRERAAEGAANLRAYTWDRFAASTAAVYREVVCP